MLYEHNRQIATVRGGLVTAYAHGHRNCCYGLCYVFILSFFRLCLPPPPCRFLAKVRELVAYAAAKNVHVLLWYNSGGANNKVTEQVRSECAGVSSGLSGGGAELPHYAPQRLTPTIHRLSGFPACSQEEGWPHFSSPLPRISRGTA